jgi:hypothetical protein
MGGSGTTITNYYHAPQRNYLLFCTVSIEWNHSEATSNKLLNYRSKTMNKITTLKSVKATIKQERKQVTERAERLLEKLPLAALDERAAFQLIGQMPERAYFSPYLCAWQGYQATLSFKVDSIKSDPALLGMLQRAVERSLDVETSDYVTESFAERSFRISLPHGGSLRIEVEPKGNSESCRKVVVGMTIKEVPQYELRCD